MFKIVRTIIVIATQERGQGPGEKNTFVTRIQRLTRSDKENFGKVECEGDFIAGEILLRFEPSYHLA